jgi:hypothetical protein
MNQAEENRSGTLVTNDKATEVLKPADGTLDNPAPFVAPEGAPILGRGLGPVISMGRDKLDAPLGQSLPQRVAIVGFVRNQPFGPVTGTTWTETTDPDRFEREFGELDLRRGRRVQVKSERSTLAIDQYHKLRSLAAFSLADFGPPFFALKKVASRKHSFQRMWSRSLSWARKARQRFSSVPSSVHSPSRRCTVLRVPYRSGSSLQGEPVQRIQSMPSKHLRSSAGGRPPLGLGERRGRCLDTSSHCRSATPRQAISWPPVEQAVLGVDSHLTKSKEVLG